MTWPPVDVSAFTWEALSTLLTGLAAVGGAIVIGVRQNRIARQQTEILQRQVSLEELRTRIELHDRRLAIFNGALDYIGKVVAAEDYPADAVEWKWQEARTEAVFLFGKKVNRELDDIESSSARYCSLCQESKRDFHEGLEPEIRKAELDLIDRSIKLKDVFAEDMGLTPTFATNVSGTTPVKTGVKTSS